VSREWQFLSLCQHTWIMGRQHQLRETAGENQQWLKEIIVHWEGFFRKNHRTTAAQVTAELNIHLEDPISTKTVWCELHKSNIHDSAATAKPLITESNAQMRKRWCYDHKTWTSDNWKQAYDMVRWLVLRAVPFIITSLHLKNTQGSLQSRMPGSNSPSWPNYYKGVHGQVG
jgi:hypothetical protein